MAKPSKAQLDALVLMMTHQPVTSEFAGGSSYERTKAGRRVTVEGPSKRTLSALWDRGLAKPTRIKGTKAQRWGITYDGRMVVKRYRGAELERARKARQKRLEAKGYK